MITPADHEPRGTAAGPGPELDLASIYEAEVAYVWKLLRRLGVPERDLEDKVQDVFIVIHRHLASYDPARALRSWIAGITVKVASDYRRRASNRRELLRGKDDPLDRLPAPDSGAAIARLEARQAVFKALDGLPPEQREVFVLHHLEGFSIPEAAGLLEQPLNTLYSRLRLAREHFNAAARRLHARGGAR